VQTPLDHSKEEDQDPIPTIFTPRRRKAKAAVHTVLRTEEGQLNVVSHGDDRQSTSSSLTHTHSTRSSYTGGESNSTTDVSGARRRRLPIVPSHEEGRGQEMPLQDERFERMLALVDDEGGAVAGSGAHPLPHDHRRRSTRNDESRESGSAEGRSPQAVSLMGCLAMDGWLTMTTFRPYSLTDNPNETAYTLPNNITSSLPKIYPPFFRHCSAGSIIRSATTNREHDQPKFPTSTPASPSSNPTRAGDDCGR
jgi:hypothetical protein